MGRCQITRDLPTDDDQLQNVQWPLLALSVLQRLAIHHEIRDRLLFDGVDLDHVRVPDHSCGASFAEESLSRGRSGSHLHVHGLDGDMPMSLFVECQKDAAEGPLTEDLENLVMPE